jgi:polysaccharide pyruvyl transferase WcaK-like protein
MAMHAYRDAGEVNPAVMPDPAAVHLDLDATTRQHDAARYAERFAAVLEGWATHHGIQVGIRSAVYGDDEPALAVAERLGERAERVLLRDPWGEDLVRWFRSLDCLIASRLHDCILALVSGTPVIAVDPYLAAVPGTTKLREFIATAQGLDHHVALDRFLSGETTLEERIEQARATSGALPDLLLALQDGAGRHFDRLADFLVRRSGEARARVAG